MLTRIFMNSDITRCKSFDINKRVFTYRDNLHGIWLRGKTKVGVVAGLLQNRDFARAVNDGQLVRESFPFSQCDYAILFFFCLVHYLDCLPKRYMTYIIIAKYTIKKT